MRWWRSLRAWLDGKTDAPAARSVPIAIVPAPESLAVLTVAQPDTVVRGAEPVEASARDQNPQLLDPVIANWTTLPVSEPPPSQKEEAVRKFTKSSDLKILDSDVANVAPPPVPELPPPISQRARAARTVLTIGFDFGTHSTKVVSRVRNGDGGHIVTFDQPVPNYSPAVCPSLVRVDNGRLWFGSEAVSGPGHVHHFLKVRLLGLDAERGLPEHPPGPTPQELVAAYWCWAWQELRRRLEAEHSEFRCLINVAAPLCRTGTASCLDSYLSIAHAAWLCSFGGADVPVTQGVAWDVIRDDLRAAFDEPVPPFEERQFDVKPESVAPCISLRNNPSMTERGFYLMIDVGGGTTEVSINNVRGGDRSHTHCYHDRVIPLGGLDLHRGLSERDLKTHFQSIQAAWYTGYQLEMHDPIIRQPWRNLTLLSAGGGTYHPTMRLKLNHFSPQHSVFAPHDCSTERRRYQPVDLLSPIRDVDASLFAVADGLTHPDWGNVIPPNEIPVLNREPPDERPGLIYEGH